MKCNLMLDFGMDSDEQKSCGPHGNEKKRMTISHFSTPNGYALLVWLYHHFSDPKLPHLTSDARLLGIIGICTHRGNEIDPGRRYLALPPLPMCGPTLCILANRNTYNSVETVNGKRQNADINTGRPLATHARNGESYGEGGRANGTRTWARTAAKDIPRGSARSSCTCTPAPP